MVCGHYRPSGCLLYSDYFDPDYSWLWYFGLQNSKPEKNPPVQKNADKPKVEKAPAVQEIAVQEEGISGEIIAAIAAAVAAMEEGTGSSYSIRSVRRSAGTRPVWGAAGLMENTRPF